jgi:predicted DNA-binding protein
VHLKERIPNEIQAINKIKYNSKYVTIHFGLTEEQSKKLKNLAEEKNIKESEVLREIIDDYFNLRKKPSVVPFKKISPIGFKRISCTIGKEQDIRLRKISANTGRKKSELVREAVERFV